MIRRCSHAHLPRFTVCVFAGKGEDTYPDLLALFIALLVTLIIALGVRNSVGFNNVLNVVNLLVWVFIVLAGLFFLSASNWEDGRFLPYGWSGVSGFVHPPACLSTVLFSPLSHCPFLSLSLSGGGPGDAGRRHLLLRFHWL